MGCYKCNYYDHGLRRCKIGKVNPPTIKGAIEAVRTMGSLSYVCNEDGMKDKVINKLAKK